MGGLAGGVPGAAAGHPATSGPGDRWPLNGRLVSPRRSVPRANPAVATPTVTVPACRARPAGPASHAIPARPAPFTVPFNVAAIVAASARLGRRPSAWSSPGAGRMPSLLHGDEPTGNLDGHPPEGVLCRVGGLTTGRRAPGSRGRARPGPASGPSAGPIRRCRDRPAGGACRPRGPRRG